MFSRLFGTIKVKIIGLTQGGAESDDLVMQAAPAGYTKRFTEEQGRVILARLKERTTDICPSCAHTSMIVIHGIAYIPLYSGPTLDFATPESILPNIAVLCADCGLTRLFNIHALGLAEVLGFGAAGSPLSKYIQEGKNG